MKRGGPLRRKKGLRRGGRLKRSPMPRKGRRRREGGEAFWRKQCRKVRKRDEGLCVPCRFGKVSNPYFGPSPSGDREWSRRVPMSEVDHILNLGVGGSRFNPKDPRNNMENLQAICRPCHEDKHAGAGRWSRRSEQ